MFGQGPTTNMFGGLGGASQQTTSFGAQTPNQGKPKINVGNVGGIIGGGNQPAQSNIFEA